eukprot:1183809-Pyramimonas_sp.AAC.1
MHSISRLHQRRPNGDTHRRRHELLPLRRGGLAILRPAPCARANIDVYCHGRGGMRASATPLARTTRNPA